LSNPLFSLYKHSEESVCQTLLEDEDAKELVKKTNAATGTTERTSFA